MKDIKPYLPLYLGAKYRLRYIDYKEGSWTYWVNLTLERLQMFLNDASLDQVQLTLRRMSDMTDEERIQYAATSGLSLKQINNLCLGFSEQISVEEMSDFINYCRRLCIDCDGLIHAGVPIPLSQAKV